MIDKRDGHAVTVENILRPHRRQTRMQGEKTVLCVRGGSAMNSAKRGESLGIRNQTDAGAQGLNLHAAVNAEGLPLSVPRAA